MKVVLIDSYNRDHVADVLLAEGLTEEEAVKMKVDYNLTSGPEPSRWATVTPDDYRLSRGMEDLV